MCFQELSTNVQTDLQIPNVLSYMYVQRSVRFHTERRTQTGHTWHSALVSEANPLLPTSTKTQTQNAYHSSDHVGEPTSPGPDCHRPGRGRRATLSQWRRPPCRQRRHAATAGFSPETAARRSSILSSDPRVDGFDRRRLCV